MWNGTEDKIKVKITWIRHGMTQANGEHRYLGKTDEPLSETGIRLLQEKKKEYFSSPPEFLYTSPMKRCVQTAELLFERNPILIPEWKEMDFGQFEGKNYEELKDDPCYQKWIDSNGTLPFPGGESREAFKHRSLTGFQKAVTQCIRNNIKTAALVIHGGTIMNIMEEYADRPRAFYEWHVKNGGGYLAELEPALWQKGRRELCVREAYMEG